MWGGGRRKEEGRGHADGAAEPRPDLGTQQHVLPCSTAAGRICVRDGQLGVGFATKSVPVKASPRGMDTAASAGQNCPWWLRASADPSMPPVGVFRMNLGKVSADKSFPSRRPPHAHSNRSPLFYFQSGHLPSGIIQIVPHTHATEDV